MRVLVQAALAAVALDDVVEQLTHPPARRSHWTNVPSCSSSLWASWRRARVLGRDQVVVREVGRRRRARELAQVGLRRVLLPRRACCCPEGRAETFVPSSARIVKSSRCAVRQARRRVAPNAPSPAAPSPCSAVVEHRRRAVGDRRIEVLPVVERDRGGRGTVVQHERRDRDRLVRERERSACAGLVDDRRGRGDERCCCCAPGFPMRRARSARRRRTGWAAPG